MRKRLPVKLYWSIVTAYAILIFLLSAMSHPLPEQTRKYFSDWVLHGVEYGILGFFLAGALRFSFKIRDPWILAPATVFLGILYGFSDEWHQSFVPCRVCSLDDVCADGLGTFCGCLVLIWLVGAFNKKKVTVHAGN